jgi:hypothetical protein
LAQLAQAMLLLLLPLLLLQLPLLVALVIWLSVAFAAAVCLPGLCALPHTSTRSKPAASSQQQQTWQARSHFSKGVSSTCVSSVKQHVDVLRQLSSAVPRCQVTQQEAGSAAALHGQIAHGSG